MQVRPKHGLWCESLPFSVELYEVPDGAIVPLPSNLMQIVGVIKGGLGIWSDGTSVDLNAGGFSLIPASLQQVSIRARTAATYLRIQSGAYEV